MSHENIVELPLEPETSSLFWLDTSRGYCTDHIFYFKNLLCFSGLLNRTIDSDIKVLNHVLITLASDHDKQKSKTFIHNFSQKINRLN
jgi:hypothetical protein